jgi:DNA-binding transcriptional ArsR family regulator
VGESLMAWQGGPDWKRSEPTVKMLSLLEQIWQCREKLGRYPRMCEIAQHTGTAKNTLRHALKVLTELGHVRALAHMIDEVSSAPIVTVYALTNKGKIAAGLGVRARPLKRVKL